MPGYRRLDLDRPLPPLPARFGMRSVEQVTRDLSTVARHLRAGDRFAFNLGSAALLRPDISLPAYAGLVPVDGVAPIFNLFDRNGGGRDFRSATSRSAGLRDFRGGRLSYDEHDGTDLVCPPGTPLCAAAPGILVAARDNWLRGGLTACVDHGGGVVTQYTHLSAITVEIGERVERGQAIARSGVSGLDLTQFFPWVPPHIHFMVWVHGRPVDPYLAAGEPVHPGAWAHGNQPIAVAGPLAGDPSPSSIDPAVDARAVAALRARCLDPRIAAELERQPDDRARAAVLEDSLHHDRQAWPADAQGSSLRAPVTRSGPRITLPLPAEHYRGARFADTFLTRPDRN